MTTETKYVTQKKTTYIANDGTQFNSETECLAHEEKCRLAKAYSSVEKLIVKELDGMPPIHTENKFCSDNDNFTWFKLNNKNELETLETNTGISLGIKPKHWPYYICYECQNEFEGDAPDDLMITTLDECIAETKAFFAMLGIDVKFK